MGWDFGPPGSKTEDAWMCLVAIEKGFTFDFVEGNYIMGESSDFDFVSGGMIGLILSQFLFSHLNLIQFEKRANVSS